ncbi:MAG: transcriptional regulator/antitoxin, MazE [Desulfobacterales bacterium]|nr:transcriptional regulator/antitoxin, MazE [Desulfobacterales bacterium]
MHSIIQKWGNSHGIRISKQILEISKLTPGDSIEISAKKGKIIIQTSQKNDRKKYQLKNLIKQMPKNYNVEEVNWGVAVGREE